MKKIILMAVVALSSLSAFALPTDYVCKLSHAHSDEVLMTATARISRSSMRFGKDFFVSVSNNMGYSLEVYVEDQMTREILIQQELKLNVKDPSKNPLKVSFKSEKTYHEMNCTRADDIKYE